MERSLTLMSVVGLMTFWGPTSAVAQPDGMLVQTSWLAERLGDPKLVLIHVGDRDEFDEAHLPGAHYLAMSDVSSPRGTGLTLQLPAVEQLQRTVRALGIDRDSRIVVYWGDDWVTPTARVYMTLDYLGLGSQTSILDGGMPEWRADGGRVTAEPTPVGRGTYTARVRPDVVVDVDWLAAARTDPAVSVLDARTADFYRAERQSRRNPRHGHIAGAGNIPYPTLLADGSTRFKDRDALAALFRDEGVESGDRVVTYCHIGQQASLLYFVAKYLGYEVSLYDGSFEEWSAREDLPVVSSGERGN